MNPQLPQGVTLTSGQGGLQRLLIDTPLCQAELYLQGAHLCQWQPKSQTHPVLWMSKSSWYEPGKPLRGGVPICFPWFGPHPSNAQLPGHGVARLLPWTLAEIKTDAAGTVDIKLTLSSSDATKAMVADDFNLEYHLQLGHELHISLVIHNPSDNVLAVEEAMHTYFTVGDVRNVSVTGLAGVTYIDKVDNQQRKVEGVAPITITGETDRLYLNTTGTLTLTDTQLKRQIVVSKTGSQASVVWNPWINKSKAMPDFGDEEWPGMICLETVNAADHKLTVPAKSSHTMTANITVQSL